MTCKIEAACACHRGLIRSKNEDNFLFDGRCMKAENSGLRHSLSASAQLHREQFFAVFDGMGGENFGEYAAFAAAECAADSIKQLEKYVISEKTFLRQLCLDMNRAVVRSARQRLTNHMGSTVAALMFSRNYVYSCNLGDSRCYRLRDNVLLQLSVDHTDSSHIARGKPGKAPLSQYLGIDEDEFIIEPYISKGELRVGDIYLICSDGLTDMVPEQEILSLLNQEKSASDCVDALVNAALDRGGKDNICCITTIITPDQ